jgi:two-component system phosphate regulon response regulator OmpR
MENKNNRNHILVVDDDDRIRGLLKDYLSENNYIVSTAENSQEAKEKLNYINFDIIILDVMMPGQNGYDFTKEIKKKIKVPVILLTAKGEVENRIKGLELGADDYLGKPFEPKELLLRVKNIIEKKNKINFEDKFFVGDAEIDLNKMIVKLNSKSKKINNSEKKILAEMLANPGKTYTREEIGKISGIIQERSIDVIITRLRQKLEINPKNPKFLQTIRGSGYVLWVK